MGTRVPVRVGEWRSAPVRIGDAREFAIGDSHGLSGHLEALLEAMGASSGGQGHLTMLGDLCDRGPDSIGCYRAAFGRSPSGMGFSGRTGLLGNHEIFLICVLTGGSLSVNALPLWLRNGGGAVLDEIRALGFDPDSHASLAAALGAALGPAIREEIIGLASHREAGNLLFVHGGVRPGVPLSQWFARRRLNYTTDDHFAWIRFPFFGHEGPFEGDRIVVHGHTPEPSVQNWKHGGGLPGVHELDGWRLGLDGGSYATGLVAGAEFRDGAYRTYVAG